VWPRDSDLTKAYPAAFANTDMGALELWAREHKHHSEAGVADSAQWAIEVRHKTRQRVLQLPC